MLSKTFSGRRRASTTAVVGCVENRDRTRGGPERKPGTRMHDKSPRSPQVSNLAREEAARCSTTTWTEHLCWVIREVEGSRRPSQQPRPRP